METWPFESVVREVVALLARGEYTALERRTGGARLSATELREAVQAYGRRIVVPPCSRMPDDTIFLKPVRSTVTV